MKITDLRGHEPERIVKKPMNRFEMDCATYYLYQAIVDWEDQMGLEHNITIESVDSDITYDKGVAHANPYFLVMTDEGEEVAIQEVYAIEGYHHDLFATANPLNPETREPLEEEFLVRL